MTDSGFRSLVLTVAGAVLVCLADSSSGGTAEVVQADFTVKIVAGGTEVGTSEASGIEIAPFVRTEDAEYVPILVAPAYEEESDKKKAAKKPAKPGTRKSGKAEKTPAATETGSRKAREEWQKKQAAERQKRQLKSKTSAKSEKSVGGGRSRDAASKVDKAALANRKKALLAQKAADKSKAVADAAAKSARAGNTRDCPPVTAQKDSRSYREIYNSIPFSRAEYDANPAYRHQATMEIMLGQLHPVIVAPPAPAQPQPRAERSVTIRFLPIIRAGYRSWSRYPWH